jgi:hypothetical protein
MKHLGKAPFFRRPNGETVMAASRKSAIFVWAGSISGWYAG